MATELFDQNYEVPSAPDGNEQDLTILEIHGVPFKNLGLVHRDPALTEVDMAFFESPYEPGIDPTGEVDRDDITRQLQVLKISRDMRLALDEALEPSDSEPILKPAEKTSGIPEGKFRAPVFDADMVSRPKNGKLQPVTPNAPTARSLRDRVLVPITPERRAKLEAKRAAKRPPASNNIQASKN